ncbi:lytic transglycosylase domain-containing protein [Bailinhaonella thermotolerans]|uniref:aggregation-promoting factor C-terminal-like domain-containing protein n=1 Tax=Bailinhaonella thermotolerans TaxID=1070861 RepID=UPI001F5BA3F6|nr:lytic transglycosylase domain-containing protein [Bailinhaonella thermotolerans]
MRSRHSGRGHSKGRRRAGATPQPDQPAQAQERVPVGVEETRRWLGGRKLFAIAVALVLVGGGTVGVIKLADMDEPAATAAAGKPLTPEDAARVLFGDAAGVPDASEVAQGDPRKPQPLPSDDPFVVAALAEMKKKQLGDSRRKQDDPLRPVERPTPTPPAGENGKPGNPFEVPTGSNPTPGSNKAIGKEMNAAKGWASEWGCLERLWDKESGWNHKAYNPSSGAGGIPQSLPASKMASAGADWRTNPRTQIKWGLGYIGGRYGSPCKAWAHWQARHWY